MLGKRQLRAAESGRDRRSYRAAGSPRGPRKLSDGAIMFLRGLMSVRGPIPVLGVMTFSGRKASNPQGSRPVVIGCHFPIRPGRPRDRKSGRSEKKVESS